MKKNCLFCQIIQGKIPGFVIWENKEFIAMLDIFPNTLGQTLVLPKRHYDSDIFQMPVGVYQRFMLAIRQVAKLLNKELAVNRTAMVMEGMGVNHAHAKLYPLYGVGEKFKEMGVSEKIFFHRYHGYLTTKMGPQMSETKLKKVVRKITKKNAN